MSWSIKITAICAALLYAPAATAEQFVVQFDDPLDEAQPNLLENLKITQIDAFTLDGAYYMVIDARDVGYVAAYVYAINAHPKSLHTLGADWNGTGLSSLPLEKRLPFLATANCTFCIG